MLFDTPQVIEHPRYISHRGFTPLAPENSIPSFEYAGLLRQWAIETDVRFTRDGTAVCCHDAETAHFDLSLPIAQTDWAELEKLRISEGNRLACFRDAQRRLPLFSEYLAVCRRFGAVPFIEMKTPDAGRVVKEVRGAGFDDGEVVMSSSRLDWLLDARREAPRMFLHWIFADEDGLSPLASAGNAGISWNIPDVFSAPQEKIDLAHAMGLKVCLRAGDTFDAVRTMLEMGLDYLPTNCMHGVV